ncbi:MAG: hypothetical protein PGN26_04295 [Xylophilus ampelinus]
MTHPHRPLRKSLAWPMAAAAAWCASAGAAPPALRCEVSYADVPRVLRFTADVAAYDAAAVDIDGRFRFRAVLRGGADGLEMVRIYVYAEGSGPQAAPPMLQEARYLAPFGPQDRPGALTGEQTVYAQPAGRPLRYACALEEPS